MNLKDRALQFPYPIAEMRTVKAELATVIFLLCAFIALCLWITLKTIPVWLDEVTVADPAVNFVLGNGFVSTGWQYQYRDEFWASNAPLHQFLLIGWIQIWDISSYSMRSINFLYAALTAFIIWYCCKKTNLIPSGFVRVMTLIALLGAAGTSTNYIGGRYDFIGILILAICLLICTYPDSPKKWIVLTLTSIFIPIAGINLIPFVGIMLVVLYFSLPKSQVYRIGGYSILGMFLGLVILFSIYYLNGVAFRIIESAGGHGLSGAIDDPDGIVQTQEAVGKVSWVINNLGSVISARLTRLPNWYTNNYSYLILVCVLLGLTAATALRRIPASKCLAIAALVAILVPFGLGGLRDYPFYYTWMTVIPLTVMVFAIISQIKIERIKFGVSALVAFAVIYPGIIGHITKSLSGQEMLRSYHESSALLAQEISPGDRVYADFAAYYPVVVTADYVLLPTYRDMLRDHEREAVNTLVVRGENFAEARELFTGNWQLTRELPLTHPYNLNIYRRINPEN